MIYKFIENITSIAKITPISKIGYIREIPESAIFYKAEEDDYGEYWYISIPSNEFTNPLDIDWKGKDCTYIQTIKLGEYTFLYVYGIKSYHWPDVGKEEWNRKFMSFFDTLYLYERRVDKFDYNSLISSYLTANNDVSAQIYYEDTQQRLLEREKFKKRFEENSKICASYKIKELLPSGEFKVIKVWGNDENDCGGVMITKIDIDYENHLILYSNTDNQLELSTNGDEFWKQYNKYIEVIALH